MTTITAKQKTAIRAILTTATLEQAALVAGVKSRTIRTWRKQAVFAEALRGAQKEATGDVLRNIECSLSQAVDTLCDLLDAGQDPQVRKGAADALLRHGLKAIEHRDITERIEALEEAMK